MALNVYPYPALAILNCYHIFCRLFFKFDIPIGWRIQEQGPLRGKQTAVQAVKGDAIYAIR